jgi:putative endonuclease
MRPPDASTDTSASRCVRTVHLDVDAVPGRAALGRDGERLALAHLAQVHGFVSVATNLRVAVEDLRGELDVVMRDPRSGALVVCEVKTRTGSAAGGAEVALGPRQQARIRRMTAVLLASGQLQGRRVRFDLVTIDVVSPRTGAAVRLGHVPDAW